MLFVPPAQEVLVRQPHFALGEALSARNPSRFRRRSVLALLKRSDQIRSDQMDVNVLAVNVAYVTRDQLREKFLLLVARRRKTAVCWGGF